MVMVRMYKEQKVVMEKQTRDVVITRRKRSGLPNEEGSVQVLRHRVGGPASIADALRGVEGPEPK